MRQTKLMNGSYQIIRYGVSPVMVAQRTPLSLFFGGQWQVVDLR